MQRKEIIKNLIKLQHHLCIYVDVRHINNKSRPSGFCDCKYGCSDLSNQGGEEHGCPEVRTAIGILERITDDGFQEICQRIIPANDHLQSVLIAPKEPLHTAALKEEQDSLEAFRDWCEEVENDALLDAFSTYVRSEAVPDIVQRRQIAQEELRRRLGGALSRPCGEKS